MDFFRDLRMGFDKLSPNGNFVFASLQ